MPSVNVGLMLELLVITHEPPCEGSEFTALLDPDLPLAFPHLLSGHSLLCPKQVTHRRNSLLPKCY